MKKKESNGKKAETERKRKRNDGEKNQNEKKNNSALLSPHRAQQGRCKRRALLRGGRSKTRTSCSPNDHDLECLAAISGSFLSIIYDHGDKGRRSSDTKKKRAEKIG